MGNRDQKSGPRHSGRPEGSPSRQEPLRDRYYYEEPPRGWQEDGFQDISSYSSPQKRREDQWELEAERRAARRGAASRQDSRDIFSGRRDAYASRPRGREPANAKRPPRRNKGGVGKKIAAVLLVLVLLVVGSGAYMLTGLTMTSIPKDDASLGISASAPRDGKIVNIALFGLDAREDTDTGRSDVVMVLSVDKRHHGIKLTSILRDSEVYIDGYGYDKITHAYAYGGPELAIKTLNQNFNLDIQNYVTVNFHQMADIVDAFGGVDMDLTADEVYQLNQNLWTLGQESPGTVVSSDYIPNTNGEIDLINGPFEDGSYHLNGNRAVAYARIRHTDSDDVRASRQQLVLQALLDKAKGNPILLPFRAQKALSACETSMGVGDMLALTPIVFGGLRLETLTIPGEEEQAYGAYLADGAWVYEYDLAAASQHIRRFIYEEASPDSTGG